MKKRIPTNNHRNTINKKWNILKRKEIKKIYQTPPLTLKKKKKPKQTITIPPMAPTNTTYTNPATPVTKDDITYILPIHRWKGGGMKERMKRGKRRKPHDITIIPGGEGKEGKGRKERKGKEREGKGRKGKERKGKGRKGKERKGKERKEKKRKEKKRKEKKRKEKKRKVRKRGKGGGKRRRRTSHPMNCHCYARYPPS